MTPSMPVGRGTPVQWWPRMQEEVARVAGDTALPARMPGLGCQAGAGMLQASWAFVPLRVDGAAPRAAGARQLVLCIKGSY